MAEIRGIMHLLNADGGFDVIFPKTYSELVFFNTDGVEKNLNTVLTEKFTPVENNIKANADAIKAIHDGANKASGVVKLGENGLIPSSFIPAEFKEIKIVDSIAARDGITNAFAGLSVYVKDASADSTVNSGGA